MKLEQAKILAEEVKALLAPYTTRCEIAGGIRRSKPEPHDIEIVCQPKMVWQAVELDVFGNPMERGLYNSLHDYLIRETNDPMSKFQHGDMRGPKKNIRAPFSTKYSALTFRGQKLDIFAVIPPAQWGDEFLIRTGDADFSHKFVYRLWDYELKSVEGHIEDKYGHIRYTPEEIDAFNLCHLSWIEPEKRNASAIR